MVPMLVAGPTGTPTRLRLSLTNGLFENVSWEDYLELGEAFADQHPGTRITYDRGRLEIVSVSDVRDRWKRLIGRLIEAMTEELDLPLNSHANATRSRADLARGLEPDESYYLQNEPAVRGVRNLDMSVDPAPDLVVEVEITRSVLDRIGIYAALGVREVWCFDGEEFRVLVLTAGGYERRSESLAFPWLPLADFVQFLRRFETEGETTVVRAFLAWVRQTLPPLQPRVGGSGPPAAP